METEKILLRYWQESDAEALFKYASDPDVGPRAGWPAHKSVEEVGRLSAHSSITTRHGRYGYADVGNENAMEQEHYSDSEYVA